MTGMKQGPWSEWVCREWVQVDAAMGTGTVPEKVSQEKLFAALMENVRYTAIECKMTVRHVVQVLEQLAESEEPTSDPQSKAKAAATPTARTSMPAQAASEEMDQVILFGKHKGVLFSKLLDTDVEYVKWILCNAEKSTYPQMQDLVQYLKMRVELYKPTRSGPTMLMDKTTGIVLSGTLKGYPVPASEETKKPEQPTASSSSRRPAAVQEFWKMHDLAAKAQADPEYKKAVAQHHQRL